MHSPRVIISGGGTGGHIFPAIAIADEIKKRHPNSDILFVGAKDKMEMEKVPAAGYKIEGLWISGLQRKLTLKNLAFPFKIIFSLWKCKKIIKKHRPDLVIGVGGFASGPLLRVASKRKIPTLIQEQNSYPGITNKILSKNVNKICIAYLEAAQFFPPKKIILTGNPVRENVVLLNGKKQEALTFFGLNKDLKTLLVVGGSLGARSINEAIAASVEEFPDEEMQIIWQTGKLYHEQANNLTATKNIKNIKVNSFISRMDLAYAAADIIISRAGAIAISELSLVKKPCILVPYPYAAEDHQTKNAMALVNQNAAILIKDSETKKRLKTTILDLINNDEHQKKLTQNISKLGHQNATATIVDEALRLIK